MDDGIAMGQSVGLDLYAVEAHQHCVWGLVGPVMLMTAAMVSCTVCCRRLRSAAL